MLCVVASLILRRSEQPFAEMFDVRIGNGLRGRVRPVSDGKSLAILGSDPTRGWPLLCETNGLSRLRHPGRRAQWLTGRLCLQDLVLSVDRLAAVGPRLVRQEAGATEEIGRPIVVDGQRNQLVEVSVSHCRDYSVAVLSQSRCSVDIERRATISAASAPYLFGIDEHLLASSVLREADLPDRPTVYWTLLESLGKLYGRPSYGRGRFHVIAPQSHDPAGTLRFGSDQPAVRIQRRARASITVFPDHVICTATADPRVDPDPWTSSHPTPSGVSHVISHRS
ncbi:4'-phosphopantetheinyl transferase superfamily protein [Actinomyces sp.]|uniref:4'-phosphopantetheinyl transferase family protein n=1 Tax=Actinomyces sp. TaxID=29317 RepID=UPI0026DD9623|nr:hypothetical protein [Actinomyces sp.]MDO4899293.1 hypothetical protein [Actinomyces sp.]